MGIKLTEQHRGHLAHSSHHTSHPATHTLVMTVTSPPGHPKVPNLPRPVQQPLPGLAQFGAGQCWVCSPARVPTAGRGDGTVCQKHSWCRGAVATRGWAALPDSPIGIAKGGVTTLERVTLSGDFEDSEVLLWITRQPAFLMQHFHLLPPKGCPRGAFHARTPKRFRGAAGCCLPCPILSGGSCALSPSPIGGSCSGCTLCTYLCRCEHDTPEIRSLYIAGRELCDLSASPKRLAPHPELWPHAEGTPPSTRTHHRPGLPMPSPARTPLSPPQWLLWV